MKTISRVPWFVYFYVCGEFVGEICREGLDGGFNFNKESYYLVIFLTGYIWVEWKSLVCLYCRKFLSSIILRSEHWLVHVKVLSFMALTRVSIEQFKQCEIGLIEIMGKCLWIIFLLMSYLIKMKTYWIHEIDVHRIIMSLHSRKIEFTRKCPNEG